MWGVVVGAIIFGLGIVLGFALARTVPKIDADE